MPLFSLVPFASEPPVSGLALTGAVQLEGPVLRARYRLAGDRSAVLVPPPLAEPTRQEGLWRTTCFELFVARSGQPGYLEVNLSPSGDWQAYWFTGYREGMAPLSVARFTSRRRELGEEALEMDFELALGPPAPWSPPCPPYEVAVSAVLEHDGGSRSYWALCHLGDRPDFHRRGSFILRVPA